MIDIKALLENEEYRRQYEQDLKNRGLEGSEVKDILFRIESCNTSRKIFVNQADAKKEEQNQLESKIAQLRKEKKDISEPMTKLRQLSQEVKDNRSEAKKYEEDLRRFLLEVPNHCHESVPVGHSVEDNEEICKWPNGSADKNKREALKKESTIKTHDKLGEELDILDFERGAKVSGARFSFIKGQGALLERALVQFMLDLHTKEHGYTEISPPYMVKGQALLGTGQLPKFEKDLFKIQNSDSSKDRGISYSGESDQKYFLIPTAEVPVTNYFAGEILKESDLPQSFVAFTPCFRSEAGSYGKDVTGLIRQHQFLKVELVKFVHPDKSYEELEHLTSHAEEVLKRLELPFRRMLLCTGDIGFGAAKCYDLEVWLPSQNEYREVSSCSNYEAFQARRANIRFKSSQSKKPQFVHTLNGSGLAVGRTLLAILENYQNKDGSVSIPKVLQPYMNGQKKIEK